MIKIKIVSAINRDIFIICKLKFEPITSHWNKRNVIESYWKKGMGYFSRKSGCG